MRSVIIIVALVPFLGTAQNFYEETTTYQYDNLNQLIQVNFDDSRIYNYVYDELGNRVQIDVSQNTIGFDEQLLQNTITVYPNPTTNEITIEIPDHFDGDFILAQVIDMNGKTVIDSETQLIQGTT